MSTGSTGDRTSTAPTGIKAFAALPSGIHAIPKEQATAIDESYEAEAAVVESLTENTPEEEAGEARADELRETGEETKDDLEDAADQMDPEPQ